MQESIVFLVRVQCRCKESSRSLSHLLMSFLFSLVVALKNNRHTSARAQKIFTLSNMRPLSIRGGMGVRVVLPPALQISADVQNYFTVRIRRTFVITCM